jgi:acyl carrier protein
MEQKVIAVLKEVLEMENKEINLTDHFRDYEEWSSLAYLSLIAELDEAFGVAIEGAEFKKLITVGDLVEAIKNKQ